MTAHSGIDWENIDTVLLDMDGTLLDLHFDNHFWLEHLPRRYADIHNHNEDTVREHILTKIEGQRGTLNWYCLDYWSEQLQLDIPALKNEISHLIAVRPYVEAFLQSLYNSRQQVILVTNAHRTGLNIKLHHTGIGQWMDTIVVSHDFNTPKEDSDFWCRMNEKHPFNPHRTLLIDDNISVLESAQRHGIAHLLTMLQPDSKQAKRQHTLFPGIMHFDEIMPGLADNAGISSL